MNVRHFSTSRILDKEQDNCCLRTKGRQLSNQCYRTSSNKCDIL